MDYLLIWDIDGTLIQGKGIGRRAMTNAFKDLFQIEDALKDIDMAGRLDSLIVKDAFTLHNINMDRFTFYNKYLECLNEEIKKINSPMAAPGIVNLLELIEKKSNFYCALGTGNIEKGARKKLELDNINRFFPTGGFGDDEMERWQMIENSVINSQKSYGKDFSTNNIYVIGDTPRDVHCGKKLNFKTVGVATGPYSLEDLKEAGADYVFQDFLDIDSFFSIF